MCLKALTLVRRSRFPVKLLSEVNASFASARATVKSPLAMAACSVLGRVSVSIIREVCVQRL